MHDLTVIVTLAGALAAALVFGERGKHARSAVGMGSLPMGIPVEIECIVEVE